MNLHHQDIGANFGRKIADLVREVIHDDVFIVVIFLNLVNTWEGR